MPQPIGTVPKKPVSAQGAFIAYKTRLLREQNPDLPRKSLKVGFESCRQTKRLFSAASEESCLGTQRLVEEKADEEWSELDDAERQIFESLSEGNLPVGSSSGWRRRPCSVCCLADAGPSASREMYA